MSQDSRVYQRKQGVALFRRGSTQTKMEVIDQISAYKDDTEELVRKYWPTNVQRISEDHHESQAETIERPGSGNRNVVVIAEDTSETGQSEKEYREQLRKLNKETHAVLLKNSPFSGVKAEKIDKKLLQGVDSDEEMME